MDCRPVCTNISVIDTMANSTTVLQVCECLGCCEYAQLVFPGLLVFISFATCCGAVTSHRRHVASAATVSRPPPAYVSPEEQV